jgi:hypothetical protein
MIETGTPDEIKESILGNLAFRPDLPLLKHVRKCFEAQELKVDVVTTKEYQCGSKNTRCNWSVVTVTFATKRTVQGALAKALRAIRAARLSMYQFNDFGRFKRDDGMHSYSVELRENE